MRNFETATTLAISAHPDDLEVNQAYALMALAQAEAAGEGRVMTYTATSGEASDVNWTGGRVLCRLRRPAFRIG